MGTTLRVGGQRRSVPGDRNPRHEPRNERTQMEVLVGLIIRRGVRLDRKGDAGE
jgi:hypothetical protein